MQRSYEVTIMNTVQSTQEKRTIRVKAFLEDFRGGACDADLKTKYNLTSAGLERFFSLLIERDIIDQEEWSAHQASQAAAAAQIEAESDEPTEFVCPSCTYTDAGPFDQCPRCGLSMKDFMEDLPPYQYPVTDGRRQFAQPAQGAATAGPGSVGSDESEMVSCFGRPLGIPVREDTASGQRPRPASVHHAAGLAATPEFPVIQPGSEYDREEVIPGMPLQYPEETGHQEEVAVCDSCKERLYPELRHIYDRSGSLLALTLSGLMLLLGFAGAWGVTLFQSYSAARLFVIYFAGMSLLLGCIFMAIAIFMLVLAREKVLCCYNCGRSFPCC